MVSAADFLYYAVHWPELRSIVQWKVVRTSVHERDFDKETESVKRCFSLLEMTSRSFSAVIQELHPELLLPVTLFYLALRALDTIEDDMTIDLQVKEPLLRRFHEIVSQEGWTFEDNGPDEKDRQLLVEFDVVIGEINKLKPEYREVITDITKKMGNGMADYVVNAQENDDGVKTIKDYELYCHYVAGVVGEGCTRLFVEAKLGNPLLLERSYLHESMGLFLQKINIIRDVREDWDDKRRFWPNEIWAKHVDEFYLLFKPENKVKALECSSDMVLDALGHVEECIFYLAGLREQSVFNFCAIPQVMAIATLALVFQNPALFQRNVKISKGEACQIMLESTQNLELACAVFRRYVRIILKKNNSKDPNFLKISIICGKIEKYIDSLFPKKDEQKELEEEQKLQINEKDTATTTESSVTTSTSQTQALAEAKAQAQARAKEEAAENRKHMFYIFLTMASIVVFCSLIMFIFAWVLGARFDVAAKHLAKGNLGVPSTEEAQRLIREHDHGEL